ncbi:putative calcium-binding protein CML7 [Phytophthora citrophthora]|uniref:Calcium-binding protein CML7 n=1 Tax=Phytophthora citrophthora TaxID=4793 RepID=A0AAD9G5I0_9STRA|nr:putative calcium-binding protein CML7 [Phytophthora citrophthora]
MMKVAPAASVRLPSLTGITQPPLPTDSAGLRYPSAALISSSQSSSSSKKRSRGQMELGSANEALRRRKATLFAAVVARRLNARRPLSLNEEVGEEYMRRLRALFHACDADEDNAVTPNELLVLMRIMGATAAEAQVIGTTASGKLSRDEVVTFDAFLEMCRSLIIRCTQEQRPLPPPSFVARCKPLKNAYNRCDTDGSHDISRTELEIALQKLGLMLSDEELDAIQERLDPNNDGCIEWSDFLCAAWQDSLGGLESSSSALHKYFSVDLFIELPSFIHASADRRQQPTRKRLRRGAVSGDEIPKSYLSRMERMGVKFLTRVSKERLKRVKRATLAVSLSARFGMRARIAQLQPIDQQEIVVPIVEPTKSRFNFLGGLQLQKKKIIPERIYGFPVEIMRHIRNIEWTGSLLGCLIGLVTGLISMGLESLLPPELTGDDVLGLSGYVLVINIAVSLLEVTALYMMAVACAFRLTVVAGLTLYPLDHEREFLARAVARAALQVGHRKDPLFGMDPMRGSPKLVLLMTYLVYKSKRYVVKFLLKLFIKRVLWRAAARTTLSATVLPIQGLFNAWTIHRVLRNCRINIVGPPCAIAALESFLLEDACFKPAQRVEYMRAMGCCLVCKRVVHPNVEIMVEHLRHHWINADSWPVSDDGCTCLLEPSNPCPAHVLDDVEQFIADLRSLGSSTATAATVCHTASSSSMLLLSPYHLRNLFFLLIVTLVIDGSLDWGERRFYVRVCEAAGVQNHWSGVLELKDSFVQGRGLDVETIFSLVQFEEDVETHSSTEDSRSVPWSESLSYLGNRIARLLSC